MKRGDIYWADLAPRSGSEQKGRRPVVIVSHDGFNLTSGWRSVIVIPLSTSESQANRGPTAVPRPGGSGGLERASVALCHQITTLDWSKLTQYVGSVSSKLIEQVQDGIKAALALR